MEKETVSIDRDKIAREARYDGKGVLTTNTSLKADEVALQYKRLWMVEQAFRTITSVPVLFSINGPRPSGAMSFAAFSPWSS